MSDKNERNPEEEDVERNDKNGGQPEEPVEQEEEQEAEEAEQIDDDHPEVDEEEDADDDEEELRQLLEAEPGLISMYVKKARKTILERAIPEAKRRGNIRCRGAAERELARRANEEKQQAATIAKPPIAVEQPKIDTKQVAVTEIPPQPTASPAENNNASCGPLAEKSDPYDLKSHPISEMFRLMTDVEFEPFKKDIDVNGLNEPIILYEGKVLDGRNRLRACRELGKKPAFVNFEDLGLDDPVAYVLAKNLYRRHLNLTPSQYAAIAADAVPYFEEEAKKRRAHQTESATSRSAQTGKAAALAAKSVPGASTRLVEDMLKIKKLAPELEAEVKAAKITASVGVAVAELPKEERDEFLKKSPEERTKVVKVIKQKKKKKKSSKPPKKSTGETFRLSGDLDLYRLAGPAHESEPKDGIFIAFNPTPPSRDWIDGLIQSAGAIKATVFATKAIGDDLKKAHNGAGKDK